MSRLCSFCASGRTLLHRAEPSRSIVPAQELDFRDFALTAERLFCLFDGVHSLAESVKPEENAT